MNISIQGTVLLDGCAPALQVSSVSIGQSSRDVDRLRTIDHDKSSAAGFVFQSSANRPVRGTELSAQSSPESFFLEAPAENGGTTANRYRCFRRARQCYR